MSSVLIVDHANPPTEITELAGYTARVYELLDALTDVSEGHFVKQLSPNADPAIMASHGVMDDTSEVIEFDDVPLVSPNGDLLVKALSFKIESGMHLVGLRFGRTQPLELVA